MFWNNNITYKTRISAGVMSFIPFPIIRNELGLRSWSESGARLKATAYIVGSRLDMPNRSDSSEVKCYEMRFQRVWQVELIHMRGSYLSMNPLAPLWTLERIKFPGSPGSFAQSLGWRVLNSKGVQKLKKSAWGRIFWWSPPCLAYLPT